MFISFNYVQIKCNDCGTVTNFEPGKEYETIECQLCKTSREIKEIKEKEALNAKPKPKRSTKSPKKISDS